MRSILAVSCVIILSLAAFAPIENHVKWKLGAKRISPTEANIFIKAKIDNGWHIYSQHIEEGGPTKTEFTFAPSKDYKLTGKTIEPNAIVKFDEVFKMNIGFFEKDVTFQQKIKLKPGETPTVQGNLRFGVCNNKSCLPPDEASFSISVPAK